MSDIVVNTYNLKQYAQRIGSVNARISRLDWRMKSLYLQVGFADLFNLIQADCLAGYSWKLSKCQSYLSQTAIDFESIEKKLLSHDPIDFKKPTVSGILETVYDVGVAVKKGTEKIVGTAEKIVINTLVSYYSQGEVYRWVQYGKAILKAAKGIFKIVKGVSSVVVSGGLSAPVAILMVVSGANDVYNALIDGAYTYTGEYDKIGKTNGLKDLLADSGGTLGKMIGNEQIGETIGNLTYYGIDLVTSLALLDDAFDRVKQFDYTNFSELGKELKNIAHIDVSGIFTTDFEQLKYEAKLAGYVYKETTNLIKNAGALYGVAESAIEFGKNLNNVFTVNISDDWKNPVLEIFDTVLEVKDRIGKDVKWATKFTKFVFG